MIESNVRMDNVSLGAGAILRRNATLQNVTTAMHVVINANTNVEYSTIGRFSYVGQNGRVSQVDIGAFCSIGADCVCGAGEHPVDYVSTHPVFFSLGCQSGVTFADRNLYAERQRIFIGNDVWIGTRVFIRDGVTIGHGAVVAAGSVVVHDIPAYAIAGGVPAKVIRYRFEPSVISELLEIRWWDWDERRLRDAQGLFASDDIQSFIEQFSIRGAE